MCRYWPNWPESLYEGVDEVDAGELHERGEHWREAQDDVGVQGSRVSNLNRRIKKKVMGARPWEDKPKKFVFF